MNDSATLRTTPAAHGQPTFEQVYAEHFPFVWRCLTALGVGKTALADVAQDVFVVVHRKLPQFRGEASLRTWLYAIVRNVASNHRRGARRRGPAVELEPEVPSDAPDPHHIAQDRQAGDFVRVFLDGLDEKKREIFILVGLEEMPVAEAAAALAIPVNTAYTRWRTVRLEFRRVLATRGGHDV